MRYLALPNRRRLRFLLLAAAATTLLLAALGALLWWLAPSFVADPMPLLEQRAPAKSFCDRQGRLIARQRGWNYQWRLPVELKDMAPAVISCTLAAEDVDFYRHHGVSYRAICRALWQNLSSGSVVSGASTISMQLAALAMGDKKRTLRWKLRQASAARKLESLYDKDRILYEYLNRVLFGGKIHGIEAASQHYFGLSASELNWGEAALLCGLPQRPNAYRPDRHPARAKERQRVVLHLLKRHGIVSAERAEEIFQHEPLRYLDFSLPSPLAPSYPQRYRHYFSLAQREEPTAQLYHCQLDCEYEAIIHHVLNSQRELLPNVDDAAAVLLDSRSAAVLALVGTLDFAAAKAGQVNAATARRSAGSTLKPFIYAEAIDGGIIVDSSTLLDAPLRYGGYSPGNYDGRFYGRISASEALSLSLNTPVLRLLAKLGVPRVSERFHSVGLLSASKQQSPTIHGLSLAMGSAGHSLLNLTSAYAVFPRGGNYRPYSFLQQKIEDTQLQEHPIYSPGTCVMISRMLRQRPLAGSRIDAAWKTGTANGHRDAWCIAYTPEFTLGVWFGNKDGRAASALSGAHAAVPAAAAIISALYRSQAPPTWPFIYETLSNCSLCAESGLASSTYCQKSRNGLQVNDTPLQRCQQCRQQQSQSLHILSPKPSVYLCEADGQVKIPLRTANPLCLWFVDDQFLGELPSSAYSSFTPGQHSVLIVDKEDGTRSARVTFTVKRNR
jgi:penicillin-binding protein 1C